MPGFNRNNTDDSSSPRPSAPSPSSVRGSTNLSEYAKYYNDLVKSRGGQQTYTAPKQEAEPQPSWMEEHGSRQIRPEEEIPVAIARLGRNIAESSGFHGIDPNQSPVENAGRFLLSLPTGMASAPLTGFTGLAEMVTGTPFNDTQGDQISTENLSLEKRAASGLGGGIDIIGLGLGGSAQALGAGRNILRVARGRSDLGGPVGFSFAKVLGDGPAGVVGDMLEEGGEEFVQQLTEDVRYDRLNEGSLGRAVEAGAWGALGGGIMSGGAMAVNSALGGNKVSTFSDVDTALSQLSPTEWAVNLGHDYGKVVSHGAASYLLDDFSTNNEIAGGLSAVQCNAVDSIDNAIDAHAGIGTLVAAVQSNTAGSLDSVANCFTNLVERDGLDNVKARLVNIANMRDQDARVQEGNRMLEENGGHITVLLNRTPNSNPGEVSRWRLTKFEHGRSVSLAPIAWTLYGSDLDGDRISMFYSRGINGMRDMGYMTDNLMDANGRVNYSSDYAPFLQSASRKHTTESISAQLDELQGELGMDADGKPYLSDGRIAGLKRNLDEAMGIADDGARTQRVTAILNDIKGSIIKARRRSLGIPDGENAPSEVYAWANDKMGGLIQRLVRDTADFTPLGRLLANEDKIVRETVEELARQAEAAGADVESIANMATESSGSTGGLGALDAMASFIFRVTQQTGENNPFFRQFPQIYASTQGAHGLTPMKISDIFEGGAESAWKTLFANFFRLVDVKFDVETAVETIFQLEVIDKYNTWRLNNGGKIGRGGIGIDTALEEFCRIRNEVAERFNKAWDDVQHSRGQGRMPGAPVRKQPIKWDKNSIDSMSLVEREFADIFKQHFVSDLFIVDRAAARIDPSEDSGTEWRLGDLLKDDYNSGAQVSRFFLGEPDIERFYMGMVRQQSARSHAVAVRLSGMMKLYSEELMKMKHNGEIDYDSDGSALLTQKAWNTIVWMQESLGYAVGWDICKTLGIVTVDGFLNTTWGKAMMSGDYNTAINALISAKLTSVYRATFDAYDKYMNGTEDEKREAKLIIEMNLAENHENSYLHATIYKQFMDTGSLDLLRRMTSLSGRGSSYSEKVEHYNFITQTGMSENTLLEHAIRTSSSEMEMSRISQDLKLAESSLRRGIEQLGRAAKDDVKKLNDSIAKGSFLEEGITCTGNDLVAFVAANSGPFAVEASEDIIAAIAWDAGKASKQHTSKGGEKSSSRAEYISSALAHFGQMAASMDVVEISMGLREKRSFILDRTALIDLMINPDADYEIYDSENQSYWHATHSGLYEAYEITGYDTNLGNALMQLLMKEPALSTYIGPQTYDISYVGGEMVVKPAMKTDLLTAFGEHLHRTKKSSQPGAQVDYNMRRFAQRVIMDRPDLIAVALLHDPNFGKYRKFNNCRETAASAMRDVLDFQLKLAATLASSDMGDAEKVRYAFEAEKEWIREHDAALSHMQDLAVSEIVGHATASAQAESEKILLDITMESFIKDETELESAGFVVGDIDGTANDIPLDDDSAIPESMQRKTLGRKSMNEFARAEMEELHDNIVLVQHLMLQNLRHRGVAGRQAVNYAIHGYSSNNFSNGAPQAEQFCQNHRIQRYEMDENGKPVVDENGEPVLVDVSGTELIAAITKEEKLNEQFSKVAEANSERFVSDSDVETLISGDARGRIDVLNKMEELATRFGDDVDSDEIFKELEDAASEQSDEECRRKLYAVADKLNNCVIAMLHADISFTTYARINSRAPYQMHEAQDAMFRGAEILLEEIEKAEKSGVPGISVSNLKQRYGGKVPSIPELHVYDPAHALGYTDALFDLGGAGISSLVSSNAMKTRPYAAAGLVGMIEDCGNHDLQNMLGTQIETEPINRTDPSDTRYLQEDTLRDGFTIIELMPGYESRDIAWDNRWQANVDERVRTDIVAMKDVPNIIEQCAGMQFAWVDIDGKEHRGYLNSFEDIRSLKGRVTDGQIRIIFENDCLAPCCKAHGKKANPKAKTNRFGDILRRLVDYTMEPIALQLKKFVGGNDVFFRIPDDVWTIEDVSYEGGNSLQELRMNLFQARCVAVNGMTRNFQSVFNTSDYKKLKFVNGEAGCLARFCVCGVRMNYVAEDGSSKSIIVPSMALATEEKFRSFLASKGISDSTKIEVKSTRAFVLSLDQACSNILHYVGREWWGALARNEITEDEPVSKLAQEWALKSLDDFSHFDESQDLKALIGMVPYRTASRVTPVFPNNIATPVMRMAGIDLDEMFKGSSDGNLDLTKPTHRTIILKQEEVNTVKTANRQMLAHNSSINGHIAVHDIKYGIIYADVPPASSAKLQAAKGGGLSTSWDYSRDADWYSQLDSLANKSAISVDLGTDGDPDVVRCAELFYRPELSEPNNKEMNDAFDHARMNNHALLIQEEYMDRLFTTARMERSEVWRRMYSRTNASPRFNINNVTFVLVETDDYQWRKINELQGATSENISAVGDQQYRMIIGAPNVRVGDSSFVGNPFIENLMTFHGYHTAGSTSDYFSRNSLGTYRIANDDDMAELRRSLIEGEEWSDDMVLSELIDWSIVDKRSQPIEANKGKKWYKRSVQRAIKGLKDSNIQDGDCIGFIRMQYRDSVKYAPVFYEGSGIPEIAGSVSGLGIDERGQIAMIVDADDIDLNQITLKWMFGDFAYKCMGRAISKEDWVKMPKPDEYSVLGSIMSKSTGRFPGGHPDIYLDEESLLSRFGGNSSIQMCDLCHGLINMPQVRANAFFNISDDGVGLKEELNPELSIVDLKNLCDGHFETWQRYFRSEIRIFRDMNLDMFFRRWARRIEAALNYDTPSIAEFFTPQYVEFNGNLGIESGAWNNVTVGNLKEFLEANKTGISELFRIGPHRAKRRTTELIFHDILDKDVIMRLTHLMTNGLMAESAEEANAHPDKYICDANGRIFCNDGKWHQLAIAVPIHDHSHSEYWASVSHTGNVSHQAMSKAMLANGSIGRPDITFGRLSAVVGDYSHLVTYQDARYDKWLSDVVEGKKAAPEINKELIDKVEMNTKDPICLIKATVHRERCLEIGRDMSKPIKIIKEVGSDENAFDDPNIERQFNRYLEEINRELGYNNGDPGAVTKIELIVWARHQFSHSQNKGKGFESLTSVQLFNCIDLMLESIRNNASVINIGESGYYKGSKGDIRVPVALLPKNILRRIYAAPRIHEKLTSMGITSFDAYVKTLADRTREVTMPVVNTIKDEGKRAMMRNIVDARCYDNGIDTISGHIDDDCWFYDIYESIERFGADVEGWDPDLAKDYERRRKLTESFFNYLDKQVSNRENFTTESDYAWGGTRVWRKGSDDTTVHTFLRNLANLRRLMGISNLMMLPANITERAINQKAQSMALQLGRSGVGPYKTDFNWNEPNAIEMACKDKDMIRIYAAYRTAELIGVDRDFLRKVRDGGDIEAIINEEMSKYGALDRYANMVMQFMSGGNLWISGQIRNFWDRFGMLAYDEAPELMIKTPGNPDTELEKHLKANPARTFIDVMSGKAGKPSATFLLGRQAMNWAKRGDMAQRNLVSAIWTEIARRSAFADFGMASLITPFLQYGTNRFGRVMQWIAPVSSFHYLAVEAVTNGFASEWEFFGTGLKFNEMFFEDVQLNKDLREAVTLDAMHLGTTLLAMLLFGMGCFQPPEDDDKKDNFKEWTFCGMRVDANWWIEDVLGLAIPYACFWASVREGEPRLGLVVNGLAYYLGNNPVIKVSDAVEALFDPMSEFEQWYEQDLEGYAKAMGGPPTPEDMIMGRATSFGLSFVTQFFTPGFVREIANAGKDWESSYKRIYKESATGDMVVDAEGNAETQYTTYSDAIIRKFTRNNPVMGLLADLILHPETGYQDWEMPRSVIYDPAQMNSLEHFSLYNDPWNRMSEKTDLEKDAIAVEVIGILQGSTVDKLSTEGFALDYETKQYVSKYIWDMVASLNREWTEFQESEYSDFYVLGHGSFNEGKRIYNELKQEHFDNIQAWKNLYYDKLWSDEFTIAKYNRKYSRYMKDANGEFYATGINNQPFYLPFPLTAGESPEGEWQANMGWENDWAAESIVTGESTGMRNLVPIPEQVSSVPSLNSWSSDGTDTGLSDRAANKSTAGYPGGVTSNDSSTSSSTGTPTSYGGYRSGGGYRRGGGGGYSRSGGGGGYSPTIYSHVSPPNSANADTIRTDRITHANYDYLRPDVETKGSREAYKRSDI